MSATLDDRPNGPADLGWRPEHRGPQPRRPDTKQMRRRRNEQPFPECTHAEWIAAHATNAGRWRHLEALAIDTETTGIIPEDDEGNRLPHGPDTPWPRIVELGAYHCPRGVDSYGQKDATRFGTLINPCMPIPPDASKVHGIKDDDVANAPTMATVADRFLSRVRAAEVLVAYNWSFDAAVLEHELGDSWRAAVEGKVIIDPLVAVRSDHVGRFWKGQGRHKLDKVAQRFDLRRFGDAHRASSDAILALGVAYHLATSDKIPQCGLCAMEWLELVNKQDRARFVEWLRAKRARDEAS